jgi:hypothetical protein
MYLCRAVNLTIRCAFRVVRFDECRLAFIFRDWKQKVLFVFNALTKKIRNYWLQIQEKADVANSFFVANSFSSSVYNKG